MLEIALLGHFDLRLFGEPVDLASRPLQKLIAYLVLNGDRSVPRPKLAGTMWLDSPESTALKNLRHYLWRLRQAIGQEYLLTTRKSVAFNQAAGYQLDVELLSTVPIDADLEELIEAVSVYKGELLPGFYDDWVQVERARLQAIFERRMQILLDRLTAEARWLDLLTWSEHWIAQAHSPEPAYRFLMTGCAGLGDLAGVALNYWRCKKVLKDSLGVEPSAKTQALFEKLTGQDQVPDPGSSELLQDPVPFRDFQKPLSGTDLQVTTGMRLALADLSHDDQTAVDRLTSLILEAQRLGQIRDLDQLVRLIDKVLAQEPTRLPAFLTGDSLKPDRPVFVGRQVELERLDTYLELAESRKGQVAFIVGDVGSGKTSLLSAFAARVGESKPELLVAWGSGNAFSGPGDPYLPFRQILNMLAGDLEKSWSAGTITTNQARRLWESTPDITDALLDVGPDLLDSLIPARPLLQRLETAFPAGHSSMDRLRKKVESEAPAAVQLERIQLYEQVTGTLRHLAQRQPLMIILDDLQWVDRGSIELLFHLGRSLAGAQILLLVAYRPDEVTIRHGHPLRPLLAEFRRAYGDIWLDLNSSQGRDFVETFIDSEPNRLDQIFRDALFRNTAGHPLFTKELLRDMQLRGDLVKDNSGLWTAGPSLDWNVLPAKIEGAIEARLVHLDRQLSDILTIAAVEGEHFTVQVVAQLLDIEEQPLLRTLSRELHHRYQLVREEYSERFGQQRINRYRFVHQMFQRYLYNQISTAERQLLHGRVGQVLEELYENKSDDLVVQLARHFDEADLNSKAAEYLLAAGDRARSLFAHQEAVEFYQRALEHLALLGDEERLARTWMRLGLTYHNAFDYRRSQEAYEQAFKNWDRMKLPPDSQMGEATLRLWQVAPLNLDPTGAGDDDSAIWLSQLYSGLVRLSSEKVIVPDIARSWEIRDGGRTYIFQLRDDARWSDGRPVTAHDFILAWRRRLDPLSPDAMAELLLQIQGARTFHAGQSDGEKQLGLQAPDDLTLIIQLEQPASYFLHLLTVPFLFPVPRHAVNKMGQQWADPKYIITNGPFKLLDWSLEDGVSLGRNPFYHGLNQGNVSRVEVSLLTQELDWKEALDQYALGKVDFLEVSWFPSDGIRAVRRQFGESYTTLLPRQTTFCLTFNPRHPLVNDVRLRRALAMAIDQEQFVRDLQIDAAVPATGGFVPNSLPGHSPDIGLPYDPSTAQRLLVDAGYPDGKGFPALEIAWLDYPYAREHAEYISQYWLEQLGVTITPIYLAMSELFEAVFEGDPPALYNMGWTEDYFDPDSFLRTGLYFSTRGHKLIQEKIAAATRATNQERRLALYQEVDKIVMEEALVIPLSYNSYPVFIGPRIRKFSSMFRWQDFILDPD